MMTLINEDKRKTEGQVALFDIFNEIENCPVSKINIATTSYISAVGQTISNVIFMIFRLTSLHLTAHLSNDVT